MSASPQLLTLVLDDALVTLNAVIGLLRRRRIAVQALSVEPGPEAGQSCLVAVIEAEPAEAHRTVLRCARLHGVRDARTCPAEDACRREIALIRVRSPRERRAELYDTVALYDGTILDEAADAVLVEVRGAAEFVLSCVRALAGFQITDVARSGAVVPAAARPATTEGRAA